MPLKPTYISHSGSDAVILEKAIAELSKYLVLPNENLSVNVRMVKGGIVEVVADEKGLKGFDIRSNRDGLTDLVVHYEDEHPLDGQPYAKVTIRDTVYILNLIRR